MSTDPIFYLQIVSIVVFVLSPFAMYRLLVAQIDSVLQLLKERLADKDTKIQRRDFQTPNALATALSSRIENSIEEISRLKEDGDKYIEEIKVKEDKWQAIRHRLNGLAELILDSDLVSRKCGAPLRERSDFPICARDMAAEGEYIEYGCGLALRDGEEMSPCKG